MEGGGTGSPPPGRGNEWGPLPGFSSRPLARRAPMVAPDFVEEAPLGGT